MATSVKLDDELKSRIQHLANARHRSPHWIMREAIRNYVEREEETGSPGVLDCVSGNRAAFNRSGSTRLA